ncbi:hypothetical protein FHW83_001042 [Duganella sp. SG902]|uniref:hypothetical protein n=1 Tax=Duganella sp. SG902 TaxID=2587016 RepID=UPI00159D5D76|nr:hypothetical protein [Duganella sp. SG902]NVM75262.1 hypothetical protein [Duganella sp. SG902]
MNNKHIYYSCSSWLSYHICERYYGNKHYAWCTPYFDAFSSLSLQNFVPPSSNPRDIYWGLRKDIDTGDLHSAKVRDIRRGIQKGAALKRKEGTINDVDYLEIVRIARVSQIEKFSPLMLVIPFQPASGLFKRVAVWQRANPLSEEYIVENLPREFFDAFEL